MAEATTCWLWRCWTSEIKVGWNRGNRRQIYFTIIKQQQKSLQQNQEKKIEKEKHVNALLSSIFIIHLIRCGCGYYEFRFVCLDRFFCLSVSHKKNSSTLSTEAKKSRNLLLSIKNTSSLAVVGMFNVLYARWLDISFQMICVLGKMGSRINRPHKNK